MIKPILTWACIGMLFACTPSASTLTTSAPNGQAITQTPRIAEGATFPAETIKRIVYVNGSRSLKDQLGELHLLSDGMSATLILNGKTYTLGKDDDYGGAVSTLGSTGYAYLSPIIASSDHVWMFRFAEKSDASKWSAGYENVGSFVVGFATDPTELAARRGTASYSGTAFAEIFIGPDRDIGDGHFTLTADFDAASVAGDIALSDYDSGDGNLFPDIALTLNENGASNLTDGGFSGSSSDMSTALTHATSRLTQISDQGFEGHFYGPDGVAIGGTFWIEGTVDTDPMVLQGGFASP